MFRWFRWLREIEARVDLLEVQVSAQDDAIARVKKDVAQLRGDFDAALSKLKNGDTQAATAAFNEIADDLEAMDKTVNDAAGTPVPPPVV